ncbi:calcineurin-like phosphoesterase C-terminal domain-containing protein [Maribellus maritimus]|uniref:calcineurin-like phosphoesterase C-terminal domain-containing protein n=1 Tax=Maribellus maritimus TaxID=2870838 RepID=UPI001EEAEEE9|nr:calcineurin-like phosphoesterase C-terminal domain-containing protein [Maribellus maritimus]MCG6188057.1 calcineurin-like phosphoesterase C-terminal domain-containing protein [Maribellus maritimus]
MQYFQSFLFFLFVFVTNILFATTGSTTGKVYIDFNNNGVFDKGEIGVKNVCVTNGEEVVLTDEDGKWQLETNERATIFIIKPSGYQVPLNSFNSPKYYFKTGDELNRKDVKSINFPLVQQAEKNTFSALFFGDPQARGMKEVNYVFHDVAEELIGTTDASFGVSLGDIVADDPGLMDDVSQGIAQIGIPWYNVFGNHDNDRNAKTNRERDKTFEHFFGPSTYAFEYGQVAFISINNIYFDEKGKYHPHFTRKQLTFIKNYLQFVPRDKLVVLMMHAPIIACDNQKEMYQLIQNREHTFSISGHVHEQINVFVDSEMGWQGKAMHHHLINATVCGSWWCGLKDERGIPHATMNDGAPNGYSIITFDGNTYSVRFKAARRPTDYQMNIYIPEEIETDALEKTKVLVNIFAGSFRSKVEMSVNQDKNWIRMDTVQTVDPACFEMYKKSSFLKRIVDNQPLDEVFGYAMDYPSICHHMWQGKLPNGLDPGTYTLTVKTTDMFNQIWKENRIFRVK